MRFSTPGRPEDPALQSTLVMEKPGSRVLGSLAVVVAIAACGEHSKTDAGPGDDMGGGAGFSSGSGGSGGSSTTGGGEAGEPVNGGTMSTGGASDGGGGTSGGAAGASSGGRGGNAGAAPGGASGDAGSAGTPEECVGASSVEGDLVVSVGVEPYEMVRSISGSLTIYATVNDLRQLGCLETVGGSLRVTVGSGTDGLEALSRLRSVGGDVTIEDTSYTSLAGLRSLSAFPFRLSIERNAKLVALTGLEGFTGVGILEINSNPALSSLEGLSGMTGAASDLTITMNDALTSLAGLDGLRSVTTNLNVSDNASLRDLTGLDGIESVDGGVSIRNNPLLSTCEAEEFAARCEPSGGSVIEGNAPCN